MALSRFGRASFWFWSSGVRLSERLAQGSVLDLTTPDQSGGLFEFGVEDAIGVEIGDPTAHERVDALERRRRD